MFDLERVRATILLITALLTFASSSAQASSSCATVLVHETSNVKSSDLVSYVQELLNRGTIHEADLHRMIEKLEMGILENPITETAASASHEAMIQREGVQAFIESNSMPSFDLLRELKNLEKTRQRQRVVRNEVETNTKIIHRKMEAFRVTPSPFEIERDHRKMVVELSKSIEVMSTPVTQAQWVEIMGYNPSRFVDGVVFPMADGRLVQMRPDNPVETISWWSALEYANRLSVKMGLRPVYDLSQIEWRAGTSLDKGDLEALRGHLRINTMSGESVDPRERREVYYETEGFRLPTEAEQWFLLHMAKNTAQDLSEYALFADPKNKFGAETQPVGMLKAHSIQGHDFYDLRGNVSEWAWDRMEEENFRVKQQKDPVGDHEGKSRSVAGGYFSGSKSVCLQNEPVSIQPELSFQGLGVRLVRTIHE